ncbi:AAA family ATPase [Pseudonocardia nigra]|uniref:AAA family ATPase n=1 Tax=Pseudonocardia nigra TaxID=1921578 RepID=UPI0027E36850|nr:AAA family ATPase [Pseudonocardia nigra]
MTTPTPAGTGARPPVRPLPLELPGRTLLLVAGMPGAGKSTLLAGLPPVHGVAVVDSETHRAALRRLLPAAVPYDWYRPLVHLLHRLAVVFAAVSPAPIVVAHLPATDARTRTAVARLAALTGRAAHLLWLDVDPEEARRGQRERGRMVPEPSFARHAERATRTSALLREGPPPGWHSATVLDRAAARAGVQLQITSGAHGGARHK